MEGYKEVMYRKGYSLYKKGIAMREIAREVCDERLFERSSELFRKSAILVACAKRAK